MTLRRTCRCGRRINALISHRPVAHNTLN
jgi:hypothetical protein